MRIIWYNRDSISDIEMRQAKEVANRLMGEKASPAPAGFGFESIPYWLDRAARGMVYEQKVSASVEEEVSRSQTCSRCCR
jgi:hypothetical protein